MAIDIRTQAAKYYDAAPRMPDDLPFYKALIPSPDAHVLELGCGTGRVLVLLVGCCGYIHGVDVSEAMVSLCRMKLAAAHIPPTKAGVEVGDITNFHVGRTFHLIIAPYRVFQNLATDAEVDGLFRCVRTHLAPGGTCILNVFHPNRDPETLRREWCTETEMFAWEVAVEEGRVTCHERRPRMDPERLVLYPELIYRRHQGEALMDEAVLKIAMRCYYPAEFAKLIADHGFKVIDQWGGYAGERYGEGPELVVQFATSG
jgi:SAM-dependent methyltransferase